MRTIIFFSTLFFCLCPTLADAATYNMEDAPIYNKVEYPLPSVPDSIKLPSERADYATLHFWDHYSADCLYACDNSAMEQALTNFAAISKMGSTMENTAEAVRRLVTSASANEKAATVLASASELCLSEAESPVYDMGLYEIFTRSFASADGLPNWMKAKYSTLWRLMQLNAPGTKAHDIAIKLRDGQETSLSKLIGRDYTVVILYDPECEHCETIIGKFAAEPLVGKWIDAGIANVVAIDFMPSDNSQAKAESMPSNWIVGFDLTGIEDEEAYYVPSTPSFYLLGSEGEVLLKDANALDVIETIWQQKR